MTNQAVAKIHRWLSTKSVQLADHKAEAFLVTNRQTVETITLIVGSCDISSELSLGYLGVQIDTRLRFDEQLRALSRKAEKVRNA